MAGQVRTVTIFFQDEQITLHHGECLDVVTTLPDESVDCIVTSPPYYGLRDYGTEGQYGAEATPAEYVEHMRELFSQCRRVLAEDGTFWLNLGDSYNAYNGNRGKSKTGFSKNDPMPRLPKGAGLTTKGLPAKSMLGIPWRVAIALQDDGWTLRNEIIWHKPNAMPESVTDRFSGTHEHIFMFSKSQKYWFDLDPLRVKLSENRSPSRKARHPKPHWKQNSAPGAYDGGAHETQHAEAKTRGMGAWSANANNLPGVSPQQDRPGTHANGKNPGDVWSINTQPFSGAHFAVFPQELPRRAILAGCKPGGTVLDTFSGSGTTGLVAQKNGRRYVGIDNNAEYLNLSLQTRLQNATLDFGAPA